MYKTTNLRLIFVAIIFITINMTSSVVATIINIPGDFAAIQDGINSSSDGDTVLVQPGIYYENLVFGGHNTMLASLFLTTGDTIYISQTIIDGDSSGSVIVFEYSEDRGAKVSGFTIRNGAAGMGAGIFCTSASPTISNNIIRDNIAYDIEGGYGGGICCLYSNALIADNLITRNYAVGPLGGFGGGIYCAYQGPTISGNLIIDNLGDWGGGGFYIYFSEAVVKNNVIADNTGSFGGGGFYLDEANPILFNNVITGNESRWSYGGGIYGENYSNPIVVNSIFWLNEALEGNPDMMIMGGTPDVTYCSFFGGWDGEGNIDADPYLRDPDNGDYHLMAIACGDPYDSPCIDAGNPDIMDLAMDCDDGLGEIRSDMGAYGGSDSTLIGIDTNDNKLPADYRLSQNYPNPFNASTIISYDLPEPAEVAIRIYDIRGRKVAEFSPGHQEPGRHEIIWQAEDMPSGVYFYRLNADGFTVSRKMILLK